MKHSVLSWIILVTVFAMLLPGGGLAAATGPLKPSAGEGGPYRVYLPMIAQATTPPPAYPWMYVQGSAVAAGNCGVVFFDGQVQYRDGVPQNGVCVYLGYYGPRIIKFSGSGGAGNGNWSFAPCGNGDCKGAFEIYVVACPPNVPDTGLILDPSSPPPAPLSDKFTPTVTDKCVIGKWTNILFRGTQ